ncbi:RAD50-interacting protein 1 [Phytophthora nicotianae]|uniref:RAD50-interacting protein 1 n=1 Tax=Phytophthora nicotianae TaxID=4792 RepID=A0A0W8CXF7_PHYNI|nr:RAD50-interacting protein 1 [Phytophthora nicotianae]
MARTHKTALIKQQMAAEAAAREATNAAAAADSADGKAASGKAAHREAVHSARTRSEKADAIQRARNGCVETEAEEDTELEEKPAATSVVIDTSEASEGGEEHEEESTGAEDDGADAELESDAIPRYSPGTKSVSIVPGVRLLMQAQAGPSSIYEYIRENSDHHVTMQDVRNLVARLRNSVIDQVLGCGFCRWYGRSRLSTQGLSKVAKPFVAKVFKRDDAAISRDRTEKEKFRRAQQAFGRISGELARLGDEAFDAAMDQFEGWWHNLRQAISGGGSSPSSDESEDLALTQQTAVSTQLVRKPDVPVKIKLNSRVVPVGRPRLNRKDSELKLRLI